MLFLFLLTSASFSSLLPLSLLWMKSPTSVRAIRYLAALKEKSWLAGLRLGTESDQQESPGGGVGGLSFHSPQSQGA